MPERSSTAEPRPGGSFKGNKQALPSKPCAACGRVMTWRKRWSRSWGEVKFCSQACRAGKTGPGAHRA